jgi:hypothetical protein
MAVPSGAAVNPLAWRWLLAAIALLPGCADRGHNYFPLGQGWWWQYGVAVRTMDGESRQKYVLAGLAPVEVGDVLLYPRKSPEGYILYYRASEHGITRLPRLDRGTMDKRALASLVRADKDAARQLPSEQLILPRKLAPGHSWKAVSATSVLQMSGPPYLALYQLKALVPVTYTIENMNDTVKVPAGTFENCLRVSGRGSIPVEAGGHIGNVEVIIETTDWYAPGVGLVKTFRREKTTSPILRAGDYLLELESYTRG